MAQGLGCPRCILGKRQKQAQNINCWGGTSILYTGTATLLLGVQSLDADIEVTKQHLTIFTNSLVPNLHHDVPVHF